MLDAGQRRQPRQRVAEKIASPGGVVAAGGKRHAGRQHAVGAEARVNALQLDEAAQQQARAREQHERQRHFSDDERAQHAVKAPAAAVTSAFAQRVGRVAGRDERGHEAKEDAGRKRGDHREGDHRQIERDLLEPRHRDTVADERDEAAMAERSDSQPGDAAGRRKGEALGEHLAHQPPAPGAKRGAHAELTLARGAPCQ